MRQKVDEYFAEFKKLDDERKQWVEDGIMTEADYKTWRVVRMSNGERFKALRDDLAERMTNSHGVAMEYINEAMPNVYALNRNYAAYRIEQLTDGNIAFNLYDEATVKRLIVDNPDVMPYYPKSLAVKRGIDLQYGKQQITNEITSSIMQGKSIDSIADSLMQRVDTMNRASAVRAARTGMTAAQNGGRMASYQYAEDMGITVRKEWSATLDSRTRDSHAALDGEVVDKADKFSNGLRYPGDPDGRPEEVYNCRCTLLPVIDGYGQSRTYTAPDGSQAEYRSYKEWQAGKLAQGNIAIVNYASKSYNNNIAITGMSGEALGQYPEYSRITNRTFGADSAISNAQKTNLNYTSFEYGYMNNCQRCVPAWELRERGFDVIAKPIVVEVKKDPIATSAFSVWNFNLFDADISKRVQRDRNGTGKEQIIEYLKKCGNNARVEISVDWIDRDFGHVFAAKNVNGEILFVDPQSGRYGKEVEAYFNGVRTGHTSWLRIDNLELREGVRKEVIANPYE